jgi:hypothetical protein
MIRLGPFSSIFPSSSNPIVLLSFGSGFLNQVAALGRLFGFSILLDTLSAAADRIPVRRFDLSGLPGGYAVPPFCAVSFRRPSEFRRSTIRPVARSLRFGLLRDIDDIP